MRIAVIGAGILGGERRPPDGPDAGKPKLSASAQGLIARGLMRLDVERRPPRLFFTEAGLEALRVMMRDGRLADPVTFAHVRRELGVDPVVGAEAASV